MRNELNSPAKPDEIDDAEEIGDDLLAVGLAAVTARSTVAPHAGGGPRAAAGWWRVTHRRRADPTTHTRRTASLDDRPGPVG
jgi:hypothetical protein